MVGDGVYWVVQLGVGASILASPLQCVHIDCFILFFLNLKR